MKRKNAHARVKELMILLAFLVPGGSFFFWGVGSCASSHHVQTPGAIGIVIGLCLSFAGGYYHYRTDYAIRGGRWAVAAFLAVAGVSALVALLANSLMSG